MKPRFRFFRLASEPAIPSFMRSVAVAVAALALWAAELAPNLQLDSRALATQPPAARSITEIYIAPRKPSICHSTRPTRGLTASIALNVASTLPSSCCCSAAACTVCQLAALWRC